MRPYIKSILKYYSALAILGTVAIIFNNPTLEMSPIASPIAKASPKLSVFANLHSAIVVAKKNTIDMINPSIGIIHNCKITPKKKDNTVFLKGPVEIESSIINDIEGYFIRAVLADVPNRNDVTILRSIKLKSIFEGEGFIPDICIINTNGNYEAVDMNASFRLFSDTPSINESFYIAADEIFKNKGSKVSLSFLFSEIYVPEKNNESALFSYEYWNGKDWVKLTSEKKSV